MKILVTGGGGFLGSHLAIKLKEEGHEIIIFGRSRYPKMEELGFTCVRGDISELDHLLEATKGIDAIFHTAATVAMWGPWEMFERINVGGTKNVIEAALTNEVKYLIYTSSPSVVFGTDDILGADESIDYPKVTHSFYGRSKAMAERLVLKANSESLKTIALRPHLIYGPGDPNILPRIVEMKRKGRLKIIGDGENMADVIHIDNAVFAHLQAFKAMLAAKEEACGEAYFVAQEKPVKIWDFVNDMLEKSGEERIKTKVPFLPVYWIGFFLETIYRLFQIYDREPPMTRFVAMQFAKSHYFTHAKAEERLDYKVIQPLEGSLNFIIPD